MHTQKTWFKVALMTLAIVGLTIGAFILPAQADEQKGDDHTIVILYNQFEMGTKFNVDGLELLCVPTHKEIYEPDGKQIDGQKDDGTKPEQKFDHFACYRVKDHHDDDQRR